MEVETLNRIAWASFFGFAAGTATAVGGGYMLGTERLTAALTGSQFPDIYENAFYIMSAGATLASVCLVVCVLATGVGQDKERQRSAII